MCMKNMTFEIMGCWVGYHDYDTRTKTTGALQLLRDYGEIIKLGTFFNRNQINGIVLQLQVHFPSEIERSFLTTKAE